MDRNRKVKVLQLDYDDLENPFAGGGQSKATYQIHKRIVKQKNIDVTVVTGNYPGAENKVKDGIEYKRIGLKNFGSFVSLLSFWLCLPFYTLFHGRKYSIILESFTAPFSTSFVPFCTKTPVIGIATFFNAEEMYEKYKIPFHWLQNILLKKYTRCIALTDGMKKKIESISKTTRVTVIPRGIEKDYLEIKTGVEEEYFLYIGRIDIFQKGLDLLISAWGQLKSKGVNIPLYIAGIGKDEDELKLKELISKENLSNSGIFLQGKVTGERKFDIISKSRAIIYPSRYETFGNVALESLAAGKPFICFDIEGFNWIPESISVKAKKENVRDLQKSIELVNGDSKLRKRLSSEGRKFAEKYSWESISQKFLKIITS